MRIRIVEKGWETFSDMMGSVKFTNAVSDGDVPEHLLMNIAGSLRVIEYVPPDSEFPELTNGKQLGFAAIAVRNRHEHAPVDPVCQHGTVKEGTPDSAAAPPPNAKGYTEAELGAIADTKGISGLREIGDKLGVSARSITDIIAKILKAQDRLRSAAEGKARAAENRALGEGRA